MSKYLLSLAFSELLTNCEIFPHCCLVFVNCFATVRAIIIAVALAVIVLKSFLAGAIVYILCEMLNYILFGKAAGTTDKN